MHPCDRYLNAIHELVDGTLGPIRRAELELHLEGCDACRGLVEDLQAIARTAKSLEPLTPPDRVWRQLADRLRAEGRVAPASASYGRRNLAMLALAATLVLAVGASLFVLRRTSGSQTGPPAAVTQGAQPGPSGNAPASDPVQDVATELALTERHFQNAIERATQAGDGVDPATAAVLQKTLLTVNDAIAESRKAMETDPSAQQGLYEMLKKKIQFLQDTIALMNMMRQGDAAGAAQIVEGGKS